jgi:hypothetical protein
MDRVSDVIVGCWLFQGEESSFLFFGPLLLLVFCCRKAFVIISRSPLFVLTSLGLGMPLSGKSPRSRFVGSKNVVDLVLARVCVVSNGTCTFLDT